MSTSVKTRQANTIKRTFSIKKDLMERLDSFPNKSKIVNEWLELVFRRNSYEEAIQKKAEEEMKEVDEFMKKHDIEYVYPWDPDYEITRKTVDDYKNWKWEFYTLEEIEKEFSLWK